jgi:hypothetical protein
MRNTDIITENTETSTDPRTAGTQYPPGTVVTYRAATGATPLVARSWGRGDLVDLRVPMSLGLTKSAQMFNAMITRVDPTGQSTWGWQWFDVGTPAAVGTYTTGDGSVTWSGAQVILDSGTTADSVAQIGFGTDTTPIALSVAAHTTGSTAVVYGVIANVNFSSVPDAETLAYVGLSNVALNKYMRAGVVGSVSSTAAYVTSDNNTAGNFSTGIDVSENTGEHTVMVYRKDATTYCEVDEEVVGSSAIACATAATGFTAYVTNGDTETTQTMIVNWAGLLYKIT